MKMIKYFKDKIIKTSPRDLFTIFLFGTAAYFVGGELAFYYLLAAVIIGLIVGFIYNLFR